MIFENFAKEYEVKIMNGNINISKVAKRGVATSLGGGADKKIIEKKELLRENSPSGGTTGGYPEALRAKTSSEMDFYLRW